SLSSTKSQPSSTDPPPPPDRSQRSVCWSARDAYFTCLRGHHQKEVEFKKTTKYYFVPGEEPKSICERERSEYHNDCVHSWVEHFNQRVVNEQRSTATRLALQNPNSSGPR
ncbi:uncharacterized protein MELLADRAFT_72078, partial [Melampsora larici-populina 98AG31]